MSKIKIYELAKELQISSKEVMELADLNVGGERVYTTLFRLN